MRPSKESAQDAVPQLWPAYDNLRMQKSNEMVRPKLTGSPIWGCGGMLRCHWSHPTFCLIMTSEASVRLFGHPSMTTMTSAAIEIDNT